MSLIPGVPDPIDVLSNVASNPIGALTDPIGTAAGAGQKPADGDIA